ncbi:MAG: hypothetical protein KGI60_02985 [Patescibacteria group bacterium]|nr:hypothetical protein [Patescibacteria group bacterium]
MKYIDVFPSARGLDTEKFYGELVDVFIPDIIEVLKSNHQKVSEIGVFFIMKGFGDQVAESAILCCSRKRIRPSKIRVVLRLYRQKTRAMAFFIPYDKEGKPLMTVRNSPLMAFGFSAEEHVALRKKCSHMQISVLDANSHDNQN